MDTDTGMIPSSPSTETSRSSSDIATESTGSLSTGSFFRDRSTTLGTLMGVSLADDEQGQGQHQAGQQDAGEERQRLQEADGWRWRRKWRRRRWRSSGDGWWRLYRDDVRVLTLLGHFLDMERRITGDRLLCGDGGGGERAVATALPLLEDGRAVGVAGDERGKWKLRRPAQGSSSSLARLPVLLTAICSGGAR